MTPNCTPDWLAAQVNNGDMALGHIYSFALGELDFPEYTMEWLAEGRANGKLGHYENLIAYRSDEAYEVEIASASGDEIRLKHGTVLKIKDNTRFRYLNYSQPGILFANAGGWHLCARREVAPAQIVEKKDNDFNFYERLYDVIAREVDGHRKCR